MLDVSVCDLEVFSLDKAFVLTSHSPEISWSGLFTDHPLHSDALFLNGPAPILQPTVHYKLIGAVWEWATHRQQPECQSAALMNHGRGSEGREDDGV